MTAGLVHSCHVTVSAVVTSPPLYSHPRCTTWFNAGRLVEESESHVIVLLLRLRLCLLLLLLYFLHLSRGGRSGQGSELRRIRKELLDRLRLLELDVCCRGDGQQVLEAVDHDVWH